MTQNKNHMHNNIGIIIERWVQIRTDMIIVLIMIILFKAHYSHTTTAAATANQHKYLTIRRKARIMTRMTTYE